jgi:hypothetical protein
MAIEIGAAFEWLADRLWRWHRARGDQRAAAKDLYFEMTTNAERALSGSTTIGKRPSEVNRLSIEFLLPS